MYLQLAEYLTLSSVIRVGEVESTIQTLIRYGMIKQEGDRFFTVSTKPKLSDDDLFPKPYPFSLRELERRGYQVMPGKTAADDLVLIAPGAYCRISDAIRNNLLTK